MGAAARRGVQPRLCARRRAVSGAGRGKPGGGIRHGGPGPDRPGSSGAALPGTREQPARRAVAGDSAGPPDYRRGLAGLAALRHIPGSSRSAQCPGRADGPIRSAGLSAAIGASSEFGRGPDAGFGIHHADCRAAAQRGAARSGSCRGKEGYGDHRRRRQESLRWPDEKGTKPAFRGSGKF